MNQLPRRALSRYGLTFQGNILSVNCQCRMGDAANLLI